MPAPSPTNDKPLYLDQTPGLPSDLARIVVEFGDGPLPPAVEAECDAAIAAAKRQLWERHLAVKAGERGTYAQATREPSLRMAKQFRSPKPFPSQEEL